MNSFNGYFSIGFRLLVLGLGVTFLGSVGRAATVELDDNGSVAMVNLDGSVGANPAGMYEWTVTGLPAGEENQLNQQWFWYSIDGLAAAPINTISAATIVSQTANSVSALYANSAVSVTIQYTLSGGGLGQADIAEGITLHNASGTNMMFHFYQYSDFNLLNQAGGDTVSMDNGFVYQNKGDTQIQETIIDPSASHFEAGTNGIPGDTLSKLNGPTRPMLNDNGNAGPADATWAYEWDFNTLTDQTIQKDKLLDVTAVPEPSIMGLLSVFGLGIWTWRRRGQA